MVPLALSHHYSVLHAHPCNLRPFQDPSHSLPLFLTSSGHPRPLSLSLTIPRSLTHILDFSLPHANTRSLSVPRAITRTFRSLTLLVDPSHSLTLLHGPSSSLAITRSLSLLPLFLAISGHRTVSLTPSHSF